MSGGLFVSTCPDCGGELSIDLVGSGATRTCTPCRRSYLDRFGYLIPIEYHETEADAAAVPVALG